MREPLISPCSDFVARSNMVSHCLFATRQVCGIQLLISSGDGTKASHAILDTVCIIQDEQWLKEAPEGV